MYVITNKYFIVHQTSHFLSRFPNYQSIVHINAMYMYRASLHVVKPLMIHWQILTLKLVEFYPWCPFNYMYFRVYILISNPPVICSSGMLINLLRTGKFVLFHLFV